MIKKRLFIILIFICLCCGYQYSFGINQNYTLLEKKGKVYLFRDEKLLPIVKLPKTLVQDDLIVTKNDSSATLKIYGKYVKIFSYSKIIIKRIPLLLYGKLQVSKKRNFYEPHYNVYPLPVEGKTTKVSVWGINRGQKVSGRVNYNRRTIEKFKFYMVKRGLFKALFGIPLGIKAGKYTLKIIISGNGSYSLIKNPFYIKKIWYGNGKVKLESSKKILLLPSKEKLKEQEIFKKVVQNPLAKQYWKGKFIYPVKNPLIVSGFGKKRRYFIGGAYLYQRFHYGVDLYGKKGTDVFAPNSGFVVFTGRRITTGNTIVIDHGLGVFSLFFHLDKIDIDQGSFVAKGCLIGEIGSTGLAESPHLHWGLLVNMVYVDPVQWIKHKF